MKIAVACDHAAVREKEAVAQFLRDSGHEVLDFGTRGDSSVDYPDHARPAAEAVGRGEADRAVLLCGTGLGVMYVANKVKGVRAALVVNPFLAEMSRRHNDANVACFGARWQELPSILTLTETFLATPFEGGRHQRRVEKIDPR
ncbi:MAG: Ribose-5-phosphate isomerase B [Planctomycetes bacterium]|nr:Ribose-5-phosphate isomerase B [Planctomycetota bacterium]